MDIILYMDIEKENLELKKFLEEHGYWGFEDTSISDYPSITTFCRKLVDDTKLNFFWYWDSQFEDMYWYGNLRAIQRVYPNYKYMSPFINFEINGITKKFLPNFRDYENDLLRAIKTQTFKSEEGLENE